MSRAGRLTLTFDNGPSAEATPFVLDELARRGLPAYFFVVGRRLGAPAAADLARRAVGEGHMVGNHSMTHAEPLGLATDPGHVAAEIEATEQLLADLSLAPDPPLFRPFGLGGRLGPHLLSRPAVDHLQRHRYTVVLWNSVPRDWVDVDTWPAAAKADLAAHDHTVLVLHDLPTGALAHLPAFLDHVQDQGIDITLDLPDTCVPMRAGQPTPDLATYTAATR
ncbi:MAG: polysaccharide deacetylase family protein [Acidimicrobiales bacterium]